MQQALRITAFLGLAFSSSLEAMVFSEEAVMKAFLERGLAGDRYALDEAKSEEQYQVSRSQYSPVLNAQLQGLKSSKDAPNSFQPALESSQQWDVNAEKAWSFGVNSKVGVGSSYTNLRSNPSNLQSHEPSAYLELSLSLWQNLMGRMDRARVSSGEIRRNVQSVQNRFSLRQGLGRMRVLYWNLIGNHSALKVSESLLETSRQQLGEIEQRQKSAIAEKADVLLSRAQVAQRESALLNLRLKEQALYREILKEVPSLIGVGQLDFPQIPIDSLIAEVSQCIDVIEKNKQIPWENSSLKDVIADLDRLESLIAVASTGGLGPELTGFGRFESNGVDRAAGEALSEMGGFDRRTWSAGLRLRIPLDTAEYKSKASRERALSLEMRQQATQLRALAEATHINALGSIGHLLANMKNLQAGTAFLRERMMSVEKKYRQGRVDLLSLVQEQDQLFNSENSVTQSQVMFLEELLNYFNVFDKTPCRFNLLYDQVNPS